MLKQKQKLFLGLLLSASCTLFVSQNAHAVTRNVPSQYSTIQAAINASQNGDTVLVSPGTYREQLEIIGKYITLQSTSSNVNDTVIAPNSGKTGIMIQQVPYKSGTPQVKINRFKITGGNSPDGQGGAITIAHSADPIIENCLIDNNHSTMHGGGILVFNNSHPTIRNNNINNNSAYMFGGGIFVVKNSSPVIYGNTITQNTATGAVFPNGGASGGGLYLENDTSNTNARSTPVITGNTITNNTADFAGGAMSLRVGISAVIEENTISGNQASYGGGVHIETEGGAPVVSDNIVQNNVASLSGTFSGSGYGGGISVYASSQPKILRNQIIGNAASRGGGGVVMAESSNSFIAGNTIGANYVADAGTYEGGGVYIANAQANILNNVIRSNTANLGGGVAVLNDANITLTNNTVVKNNATYTGAPAAGGGMFIRDNNAITATINNNVFALNLDYQIFEEREQATYKNNFIANNNDGIYFSYDTGPGITDISNFNGNGNINNPTSNISGDPLFTNPNGDDFTLQSSSTAIDAATGVNAPVDDLRRAMRPHAAGTDIGAYEYTTETNFKSPVYRFWSDEYRGHFFTQSKSEKNTVLSSYPVGTWRYEFEAYDAFSTAVASSTPMYRFWSNTYRGHFYTIDAGERDDVIANYPDEVWSYEGSVFNVYPQSYGGSANTVYRFWSPTYQHHFYTASQAEHDYIVANYPPSIWTDEGGRYKVPR